MDTSTTTAHGSLDDAWYSVLVKVNHALANVDVLHHATTLIPDLVQYVPPLMSWWSIYLLEELTTSLSLQEKGPVQLNVSKDA